MKTFYLKHKTTNEVINKVKTSDIDEAISYFSNIKRLDIDDLLKIFKVEK